MSAATERFRFIGHALAGDGPFRPQVVTDATGNLVTMAGQSALARYQRETQDKYARRNQVAFYASPLARAVSRFMGYLASKTPVRDTRQEIYQRMADDINGKGDTIDVFLGAVGAHFKARGSVLLLVDMPRELPGTRADQLAERRLPTWTFVLPETLTDYALGDDGKFRFAEFEGTWTEGDQEVPCIWHFDTREWWAKTQDKKGEKLGGAAHPLGECPLIIGIEGDSFPHFGPFAAIADIARRLFNAESELDEILRGQTFSVLTMQTPDTATPEQKLTAAKVAGETVGTQNMLVHTGSTPQFIAPPSGPAEIYLKRIDKLERKIDDIALIPQESAQRESGDALRSRFQALNGELARFAGRMEDLERRAWALSQKWLRLTQAPITKWPRDYNVADIAVELETLKGMRDAGMPREVIVEQQKRIVAVQFPGLDPAEQEQLTAAIDAQAQEPTPASGGNVVPLPDRNAGMRQAITAALSGAAGGAGGQ